VLILLDSAATESQVTPLLPGAGGCLVLVTSRRQLTGLDAVSRSLDTLPPSDAVALFRQSAGDDRNIIDRTITTPGCHGSSIAPAT
jgi:hypothetical protein